LRYFAIAVDACLGVLLDQLDLAPARLVVDLLELRILSLSSMPLARLREDAGERP
jgi:hypothetical protein